MSEDVKIIKVKVEDEGDVVIKVRIPKKVKKALEELCYFRYGDEIWKVDSLSDIARECLLRGFREIMKERSQSESGDSGSGDRDGGEKNVDSI